MQGIPTRHLASEALGTGLLVATVVGSGIMAERLTDDVALQLLCNALPTAAILVVLIATLGPVSGAHFNPAVTLAFLIRREMSGLRALAFATTQVAGGVSGTFLAHLMFAGRSSRPQRRCERAARRGSRKRWRHSDWCWSSWRAFDSDLKPCPGLSASSSGPPTGSLRRLRSPIPPSRLRGGSRTAFREFAPWTFRASLLRNCSGPLSLPCLHIGSSRETMHRQEAECAR